MLLVKSLHQNCNKNLRRAMGLENDRLIIFKKISCQKKNGGNKIEQTNNGNIRI
ncbi:hypothetical protein QBE52_00220 [Clostridiaceae bacterium 35-E11]